MSLAQDLRQAKRAAVGQLGALRDQAKLQLHLLSLDARARWNHLEREITALEEQAYRDGEKAAEALQETSQRLTGSLNDLMASHAGHAVGLSTNVRSLMTTPVRTCRPDDSLAHAAQVMWDANCGAIPVDAGDRIVGVITDRDICMAGFTQGKPLGDITVESAMSKSLYGCGPDESVGAALATMADKRVRRLPVLDAHSRLLGIIAISDVSRWARSLANPTVESALTDTLAAISAPSAQKLSTAAE